MNLEKSLVATDLNPQSMEAGRWFHDLVADSEIILLHVISTSPPPSFLRGVLPDSEPALSDARGEAEERLRTLAASMGAPAARCEVRVGRPAEEIARVAEDEGAGLIVVGAHGQQYTAWNPLGSVAEQVIRCSGVPALVAHSTPEEVERILVSVDDTGMTDGVLNWAGFLAQQCAARLVALHVLDQGVYGAARGARSAPAFDELQDASESAARDWLAGRVEAAGLDTDTEIHIVFGDPKYEIVGAIRDYDADLVVVGCRGISEVGPAKLGTVAVSVLRGSPSPVLVVTSPPA